MTDAEMIAEAMTRFTGTITVLPSYEDAPPQQRSDRVDPATKPKRAPVVQRTAEEFHEDFAKSTRRRKTQYDGSKTIKELATEHGMTYSTLQRRLSAGMSIEEAVKPHIPRQRRLTHGQVLRIRASKGVVTAKKLAEKYAVHIRTIEQIWSGRTWKRAGGCDA